MAPRNTSELFDDTKQSDETYPVGSKIEVIWNMPRLQRMFAYVGHVSVAQDEKAKQSEVVFKHGPERIKQVAATYTLKTESLTVHNYVSTDDGLEIIESWDNEYVSDLIFDANNKAFKIRPVAESIPQPRAQL